MSDLTCCCCCCCFHFLLDGSQVGGASQLSLFCCYLKTWKCISPALLYTVQYWSCTVCVVVVVSLSANRTLTSVWLWYDAMLISSDGHWSDCFWWTLRTSLRVWILLHSGFLQILYTYSTPFPSFPPLRSAAFQLKEEENKPDWLKCLNTARTPFHWLRKRAVCLLRHPVTHIPAHINTPLSINTEMKLFTSDSPSSFSNASCSWFSPFHLLDKFISLYFANT